MKKISLIGLFLCLCLGFQVQAQEVKVLSLQDKRESLTTTEQENLEFLKSGTPQKLLVTKENGVFRLWENENGTEVIEIESPELIVKLNTSEYANDKQTAKVLLLSMEAMQTIDVDTNFFNDFTSLKYILIQTYDNLEISLIQEQFQSVVLKESIEIIIERLEQSN